MNKPVSLADFSRAVARHLADDTDRRRRRAVRKAVVLRAARSGAGTQAACSAVRAAMGALDQGHSAAWAVRVGTLTLEWWQGSRPVRGFAGA